MKIKTSELTNAALDWVVAKCEGYSPFTDGISWIIDIDGTYWQLPKYSTDWSKGGPIIERERIELKPTYAGWTAFLGHVLFANDRTPLIAAMRCYVASKLGDEVEIPNKLVL